MKSLLLSWNLKSDNVVVKHHDSGTITDTVNFDFDLSFFYNTNPQKHMIHLSGIQPENIGMNFTKTQASDK